MDLKWIPLLQPSTIVPAAQLINQFATALAEPGVYGWWFKTIPPQVPSAGCLRVDEWTLLHVGIAPSGHNPTTTRNLAKRLQDHVSGLSNRSTLRKSLGCLLKEQLNLQLIPNATSKYLTFGAGEERLSRWIKAHTGVSWIIDPQPWLIKPKLLQQYALPLNIKGNNHPFVTTLKQIRAQATLEAR